MNNVSLMGNLVADPETRETKTGDAVLSFRIATSERVQEDGEWKDRPEYHNITVFGKRAEGLGRILVKGACVLVQGKLRTDSYEKNGEKRYSTKVIAFDVELPRAGGGKKHEDESPEAQGPKFPAPPPPPPPPAAQNATRPFLGLSRYPECG